MKTYFYQSSFLSLCSVLDSVVFSCVTHQISSSTPQWSKVRWISTSDGRWSWAPCTGTWRNTTTRALLRPSRPSETSRLFKQLTTWKHIHSTSHITNAPPPPAVSFMPSSGTALCWSSRRRRSAIWWRQESFSSALDSGLEWGKTVRGNRTCLWLFSGKKKHPNDNLQTPCWNCTGTLLIPVWYPSDTRLMPDLYSTETRLIPHRCGSDTLLIAYGYPMSIISYWYLDAFLIPYQYPFYAFMIPTDMLFICCYPNDSLLIPCMIPFR